AASPSALRLPARNESTEGVVSDGVKRRFERWMPLRSGCWSRPNGTAHGTATATVEREPISIVPSAGGPLVGVPWKDALSLIVICPPGRRRNRSGEAVRLRPAPPV